MAGKGGECAAVQSEFHSLGFQDEEKEDEPTFIEQPPDRYICLICHCVMKEPHIVTCCCKKMCRDCIQRVHFSSQPCPTCREPNFNSFLEKQLNSEILDLKVRCTHHDNGCEWVGELRDLKKHTNPVDGSCGFVTVKCPFGCPMAYLRKDTINHESVCTNLPPEQQIKRTMRITDQFKEELQATLSQFQELYKSESTRVKELTTQLELSLEESHKKEQQNQEKMKSQFEAEKKQLLEESKQQIAVLTQELKMKNEEHQQQMMQLQQEFKKKEKERSEAVNKQLAELKEKEKQMEIQHQKQLIDIKDKLSTELKELYQDEHKQRIEESKEQSKNIHQKLKQHYDEEYQQQLKEAKRTLELEKRKQLEEVKILLAAEKEKLITEYAEECKKATTVIQTNPSHHAQHNQVMHTHSTVNPIPEQFPDEGGSNEGAAATGSGSAGDGKTFTGLSKDVLLLMPKVREECSKNMQFFPEEGKAIVLASSEEEREQCITQFQNTYQDIIKNRQFKSGSLEIPPAFQIENMFELLEEFDAKYTQCHFSCDEKARVVRIVSMSSRQFDQAKKLLGDRLAGEKGEKWEEKTGKMKEEKRGKAAGATGVKISTKTGSSEVLSINKGRKLTVKRSNIVEEDVDAIVNAANSRLDHGAGVAGALSKASRGELQRASETYVRNYGQVPVGGAAVTSAGGKLKCKRVIHAVGPIASSHMTDLACSQLIYQAITNSLIEAEKMKAVSVSFPALSTGIYAVNKSLAADAIFQAILKYPHTDNSILKDIHIVILDEETYSVFAQHLLAIKSNPIHTETSFQSPGADTHGNVSQSNGSSSHGSHTPGPAALSENSPHGGKSKTWSGTGSGATGTGNVATWIGQGATGFSTTGTKSNTWSTVSNSSYGSTGSYPPTLSSAPPGFDPATAVVISQPTGTQNIMYPQVPQLPGDGPFQATNQSGGGANGQQQPSSADLPQLKVVLDFTNKGAMTSSSQEENFSTPTASPPITPPPADKGKITAGDVGCPICRNDVATDPTITTKCCNQVFCKSCLKECLKHSPYCPTCKEPLKKVKGNQPPGGTMNHYITSISLPGYEGAGTINIFYDIPGGIQTKEHPNPGQPYYSTKRAAYLPNTPQGQEVLRLLKKAFDAQLIFTVGRSHTTGTSNAVVWNDIHHKTVTHGNPFGYPDPTYLTRVKEELKAKGIQ